MLSCFPLLLLFIKLTNAMDEFTTEALMGNLSNLERMTTTRFPQYTRPTETTIKHKKRTTPARISFEENCDYLVHYCLKAYLTGKLCARTLYYTYHTFKNYCFMDYVNCMERYEVWQVVHMGECFTMTEVKDYAKYPYDDDYFLDQYYVLEDH